MSDFDKEAEREKLREKYERDQQDREATERMSDLLLKGATMTNAHCGTCGDPIFRHEGQEFCPTCQQVVSDGETADSDTDAPADEPDATPADASAEDAATTDAAPIDVETPQPSANGRPDASDTDARADAPRERQPRDRADTGVDAAPVETGGRSPPADSVADAGDAPATEQRPDSGSPATGGDLAAARTRLARTVTRLAERAEASDDLERTRAYLGAVEEAADALAAVKRADR